MKIFGKRLFRPRSIWIRKVVQWFFFLLIALIAVNHTLVENGGGIPFLSTASLHALCPFGGVVTIYQYATVGTFVQKIHEFLVHFDDPCLRAVHPVWTRLLRLGLPDGNGAGMGQQTGAKNFQAQVQSFRPREAG